MTQSNKRRKMTPNRETYCLLREIRSYCEEHEVESGELARDANVTRTTAHKVITGKAQYLKFKTFQNLKGWLDAAQSLEPNAEPSGPYYPPKADEVGDAHKQLDLPLQEEEPNESELERLRRTVREQQLIIDAYRNGAL